MLSNTITRAIASFPEGFRLEDIEKSAERIRSVLEEDICCAVTRCRRMDYSCSEAFEIGVDEDGLPADVSASKYIVKLFVSYRGPLYAIRPITRVTARESVISEINHLPPRSCKILSEIDNTMRSLGYERVNEGDFLIPIDGHVTAIDGLPATLFDVLFSELV